MITKKVEASIRMIGAFIMEIIMMKIIACTLILMAMLFGVAVLGFFQELRSWSDIFR